MDQLEAVNLILRRMGEVPVTSVDEQYPTLALIIPALEEQRLRLLNESWWFNTYDKVTYSPALDGTVVIPEAVLVFYPDQPEKYAYTGRYVVDATNGSTVINVAVTGRSVLNIAYADLPAAVRYCITYKAAYDSYVNDFGPDKTADVLLQEYGYWYGELSRQHTRQRKANTRTKPHYQRYLNQLRN